MAAAVLLGTRSAAAVLLGIRPAAAVLLTLGTVAGVAAVPAQASPPITAVGPVTAEDNAAGSPLRVVLDTLAPAVPGDRATLRIRGRVVNMSDTTVSDVSVRLRRSSAPVAARPALGVVAESALDPERGEPADVTLTGTTVDVTEALAPGAFGSFSLRVPVSSMGFTDPGSYVVAVEVTGRDAAVDEFDERKGILRTFVPWMPTGTEVSPVSLAWLWPLATWPAQTASGVLLDTQMPAELAPDGRLGQLVEIGLRHQATVSWVADPSLLQIAQQMADGYQVVRDGTVVVGSQDAAAAQWSSDVARATRVTGLQTMPYADVDASALVRGDMQTDVVRSVVIGPRIAASALGQASNGGLYWAPIGRLDQPTLDVLASAGVTTVVLAGESRSADDGVVTDPAATAALPTASGTITGVLADPTLTRVLALPQRTPSEIITARQRFLAETATSALLLESADARERILVAAPPSVRWNANAALLNPLLRATRTAPWLQPTTLTTLLEESTPSTARRRGGYGEKARESELDRRYVSALARTNTDLATFTSIIDNPTGIAEPYSEALLRASSSAWRSQPDVGAELLTSIQESLQEQTGLVRVLSDGTVTLSGDSGKVPVTIVNDLDRSVTVGVALRGRPSLRLDSEPVQDVTVEAGRMASIDLTARVIGGEPLSVDVQLLGPDGQDYGAPATITVMSTAYARAASWVVAAAFIAIVVFVIVGVIRRIHKAQSSRSASGA